MNQNNYAMLVKLMDNDVLTEKELNYSLEEKFNDNRFDSLVEKSNLARCLYISFNKKKDYELAGKYLVESNKLRDEVLEYEISKGEYFVNKIIIRSTSFTNNYYRTISTYAHWSSQIITRSSCNFIS